MYQPAPLPVKNIIFDLGGVLLNLNIQKTLDAFRELGIENIEHYFGLGHADSFFKHYETGHLSDREFLDALKALVPETVSEEQLLQAWNAMLLDFPLSRIEWLKELKNRYRLFLFSNTNELHLQAFVKIFDAQYGFSLDNLFEKAYYSHRAGVRKPDGASYLLVVESHGLMAGETLFIDDALNNVEAAIAVGLQGRHLRPGEEVTELKEFV